MASRLAAKRGTAAAVRAPYQRSTLPNGLRVLTQPMPTARSVSVGLFVGVGSRHEDAQQAGLSHLLEHLVFKGTEHHPDPGDLSEAVEGCGGSVNASTDRELTVYSAKTPAEGLDRALEVVSDLVFRPILRARDLVAEKPVIVDEIRMYVDSPGDHVFSLFDEMLFDGHPLGREIAGTPRSVRRARREAVTGHWARWYRPEHVVLAVAGNTSHAAVLERAESWFTDEAGEERTTPAPAPATLPPIAAPPGTVRIGRRKLSQGNLCIGMTGVPRDHPDRWALDLLAAVLGDGMSSRLFLELRERRSLAYDVSTFGSSFADCGVVGVHAGFDPEDGERVVAAILEQLERVVQEPVTSAELERARAYTRGRLQLRMEDTGAVASWLGSGESLLPRILSVEEVLDRLDALTADDLLRAARAYTRPDQARLVLLGPFTSRRRFERMLSS